MSVTLNRREMMQVLGAGLLVAVTAEHLPAQVPNRRGPNRGPGNLAARLHIGKDGIVTVMSGKVEGGQGARAQLTQAAAEELHVPATQIRLILGDTDLCPDDGPTVGSRTTPSTVPAVRKAAAAAREVLVGLAAKRWELKPAELTIANGVITHGQRQLTFGDLVGDDLTEALKSPADGVQVSDVRAWKVLGTPLNRPNGRDIVTGKHEYPSGIVRDGMLYGMVLRPPKYGQKLTDVGILPVEALAGATVVRQDPLVGVVAPTTHQCRQAIAALAKEAKWSDAPKPPGDDLYEHLRTTAKTPLNNPHDLAGAAKSLKQEYRVAYVQHAPLEPRAAVAEWTDGRLTVWTATQNPFRVKNDLQQAFSLGDNGVRVIVPDFGGGFGGKHTGECAVEAARLAKGAGKPVKLVWTREEEFQWAYFRPAGLILAEAALTADGSIGSWYFVNVNSGPSGLRTPYKCGPKQEQYVESTAPPLRHGSYRGLAATANHFAREVFIDELADAAGQNPLAFRLKHIDDARLSAVLKAAAEMFDFAGRSADPKAPIGIACGIEKGSYVANCVEIAIKANAVRVKRIAVAYECGKIQNPTGLMAQVKGGVLQGLGPALFEEIVLKDGQVTNPRFSEYRVPRFADIPTIDVNLLDRPDLPSAGAGETPIVGIAPAIANAVYRATGKRARQMPIRVI